MCTPTLCLTLKMHFDYRNHCDKNINKVYGVKLHEKEGYNINFISMHLDIPYIKHKIIKAFIKHFRSCIIIGNTRTYK